MSEHRYKIGQLVDYLGRRRASAFGAHEDALNPLACAAGQRRGRHDLADILVQIHYRILPGDHVLATGDDDLAILCFAAVGGEVEKKEYERSQCKKMHQRLAQDFLYQDNSTPGYGSAGVYQIGDV